MAAEDVGKTVLRHTEHGEAVAATVAFYKAGRDAGDHLLFGASSPGEKNAGAGDTFRDWLVDGHGSGDAGTFSFR